MLQSHAPSISHGHSHNGHPSPLVSTSSTPFSPITQFILAQPMKMAAAKVVEMAAENNITTTVSNVYQVRSSHRKRLAKRRAAASTARAEARPKVKVSQKRKPSPTVKRTPQAAPAPAPALPASVAPPGMAPRAKRTPPAPPVKSVRPAPAPESAFAHALAKTTNKSAEYVLRLAVAHLGAERAKACVDDVLEAILATG